MRNVRKSTRNTKLACEQLESRRLLAIDASIINGDLVITGNAEGTVAVTALEDGSIEVKEGDNLVANLSGFNDDIRIQLDADGTSDDSVVLKLDQASVDRVMVDLGDGNNELTIESGTIQGSLLFRGGAGDDSFSLGESVDVLHSVYAWLGDGDNTAQIDGSIARNLSVRGGEGDDLVTIEESGLIQGNARIQLGDGSNEVNHSGEIEGDLFATSTNENDTLQVDSATIVGGRTTERFGFLSNRGNGHHARRFFH